MSAKRGMFDWEWYFMMLLPFVFLVGLVLTLISASLFDRVDDSRRAYCEMRSRSGESIPAWCAEYPKHAR